MVLFDLFIFFPDLCGELVHSSYSASKLTIRMVHVHIVLHLHS